jgi:hypothetical protein
MAIPCSQQKLHKGQRSYGKAGVIETVPIVKTSKPNYNAYSFTKHKKVYLTTHSKTSLTQSINKSTNNVQQWQSRCYKAGLDAVTSLRSNHSFLLCVLWKHLDTQNQTSQLQYKKLKVHNFKYQLAKL